MPNIITADELRTVLGVSDSLYSDAYLNQIIDSAELTILPMLTAYESAIVAAQVRSAVIYFYTQRPNYFVLGQEVDVSGAGLTGAVTVTSNNLNPYQFTADYNVPDTVMTPLIPAGVATLSGGSAAELYAGVAPIKSALLVVSVEIFQSVTTPGNMTMSDTFNPSPFVLGRSLQNRVIGLLGAYLDVETMCQ
ncbi:hypothetical protein UFOVP874_13 [uncultured Caudovirales phage]|uniref:Gp6 domain containing protein n=1 Tax=uncultured Caudovirales phage TaxID=2100421 RepID=A0A6J5PE89_9CAUD|nr:hypothetical protein UFOVP874_13 [uncultured Caudovirales phage]